MSKAEKGQIAAGFELKRAGLRAEPSQLKLLQTWILQTELQQHVPTQVLLLFHLFSQSFSFLSTS